MTKEGLHVDPCASVFSALAAKVKSSDLVLEDNLNDQGLSDEERLVLAYLRHRVRERANEGAQAAEGTRGTVDGATAAASDAAQVSDNKGVAWDAGDSTSRNEGLATEYAGSGAAGGEHGDVAPTNSPSEPFASTEDDGNTKVHPDEIPEPEGEPLADTASGLVFQSDRVGRPEAASGEDAQFEANEAEAKEQEQASASDEEQNIEGVAPVGEISSEGAAPADGSPVQTTEVYMPKAPSGIPQVGPIPATQPERVSLPNAKANTPYAARIEGYSNLRMRDEAGSGLVLEVDGTVRAEAMPAGEYKLDMGGIKDGRLVSIVVRLSVIARPQDLWTSIPSDQGAPLAKPDEKSERIDGAAFLVAASKRGRSHAKEGSYRDDDFGLSYDPASGWHVMVVADGAGSARLSREGSRVACDITLQALKTLLPEAVDPKAQGMVDALLSATTEKEERTANILRPVENSLMKAACLAALEIRGRAEQLECREADLSTTLAIAAAKKIGDQWLLLSFSIGDGGVGVWDVEAGEVVLMCRPDSGEFAGQTRFLSVEELTTGGDRASRVFAEVRKDFTAFIAMTDGITDPKFETDAALGDPERWRSLWEDDLTKEVTFSRTNANLEEEFLGWMDFWSRGNHDDRTLAVMVLRDAESTEDEEGVAK